jgi:hypothetical protein
MTVSQPRRLAAVRRLIFRGRKQQEQCELCAAPVADEHEHLVDPENRRLMCVCQACALLFDESGVTRYRRVPRDVREPVGLEITDEFWNGLAIPIGLVFFFRSSKSEQTMALYPSPAGPTETTVDDEAWQEMAAMHSAISTLRPDIEALIVNRTKGARDYFIVPIDQCYKLTGIIRRHWQGFSGGDEVWARVREFFEDLRRRSRPEVQRA